MIRIVMLGRLGNNLFQYALGRVLAEKHNVPLIMDGSWFNREGWDQVKCLRDLPGPASGTVKVIRCCSIGARALLRATGKHYWDYRGVPVLRESENDKTFDPEFMNAPSDCFLFGYFQTPLYFKGHENALRSELSTHGLGLEAGREALAEKLREPCSVGVHVRRTDYVGNPNLNLCDTSYYRTTMNRLRESLRGPRFFIFSDDPAWCAANLAGADVEVVPLSPVHSALADMHLMSLANHHIIPNSSFSWWAAWLGKKDGQRVLMPSRWFASINAPIGEKQCEGWEII
ncbi:MAG: alpha-1,2-fucosyltransferase [Verrucomicrobiota bacterium]